MKKMICLFAFVLIVSHAFSQWTTYTTANSNLIDNDVQAIAQDPSGNMWFATMGGVSKFDGTTWTNYTSSTTNLNGNTIRDIIAKGNGDIWVAIDNNFVTGGGIFSFNGTSWTDRTSNITNLYLKAVFTQNGGTTWAGGQFEGLCERSGTNWTKYTTTEGLVADNVMEICEDLSGNIWVATTGGVSKYNGTTFTNYTAANGLITNGSLVLSIACGPDGVIWTGSQKGFSDGGGISRFDGTTWTTYYSQSKYWTIEAIKPVNAYYCWFGTGTTLPDGARIFNQSTFTTVNVNNSGLVNNNINDIFIDNQNRVWFATDGGISLLTPELSISSVSLQHNACGATNSGEITIQATSTYPDRFYSIDGGNTYSSSNTFTNLSSGTYYISVTDSASLFELDTVEIIDIPEIALPMDTLTYCQNDTGFLYYNGSNFNWTPSNGVLDSITGVICFITDISQKYYVSMSDSNGCAVSDSIEIIVNPSPTANVTVTDDSVFTANDGFDSYQWYFYGTAISGETDSVYIADAPGIYTVAVSNSFGCTTVSDMIHYNNAGISDYENIFSIYPNPSAGILFINADIKENVLIEMLNLQGQLVFSTEVFIDGHTAFDVSHLAKSFYFLRIKYDKKMEVRKIIIE